MGRVSKKTNIYGMEIILTQKNIERKSVNREDTLETENVIYFGGKQFFHKSFEDRMKEYNGKITVCDFEWGEPKGREAL